MPMPNPLVGTPMGPFNGVLPANPLMQSAMSAAPPPAQPPGPQLPTRQNHKKAVDANGGMSKLLAQLVADPSVSSKAVLDALATAVGAGFMSSQQAASEIAKMPSDQAQLRSWVQQHFIQNMEMGRRLSDLSERLPPVPGAKVP